MSIAVSFERQNPRKLNLERRRELFRQAGLGSLVARGCWRQIMHKPYRVIEELITKNAVFVKRLKEVLPSLGIAGEEEQACWIAKLIEGRKLFDKLVARIEIFNRMLELASLTPDQMKNVSSAFAQGGPLDGQLQKVLVVLRNEGRIEEFIECLPATIVPEGKKDEAKAIAELRSLARVLLMGGEGIAHRKEAIDERTRKRGQLLAGAGLPPPVVKALAGEAAVLSGAEEFRARGYLFVLEAGVGQKALRGGAETAKTACNRLDALKNLYSILGFSPEDIEKAQIEALRKANLTDKYSRHLSALAERVSLAGLEDGEKSSLREKLRKETLPVFAGSFIRALKSSGKFDFFVEKLSGAGAVMARILSEDSNRCGEIVMSSEEEILTACAGANEKKRVAPIILRKMNSPKEEEKRGLFYIADCLFYFGFRGRILASQLADIYSRRKISTSFALNLHAVACLCRMAGAKEDQEKYAKVREIFGRRLENGASFAVEKAIREILSVLREEPAIAGYERVFTGFSDCKNKCLRLYRNSPAQMAAILVMREESLAQRVDSIRAIKIPGRKARDIFPFRHPDAPFLVGARRLPEWAQERAALFVEKYRITQAVFDRCPTIFLLSERDIDASASLSAAFYYTAGSIAGKDALTLKKMPAALAHIRRAIELAPAAGKPGLDARAMQSTLHAFERYILGVRAIKGERADPAMAQACLKEAYDLCTVNLSDVRQVAAVPVRSFVFLVKRALARAAMLELTEIAGNTQKAIIASNFLHSLRIRERNINLYTARNVQEAIGFLVRHEESCLLAKAAERIIKTIDDPSDEAFFVLNYIFPELKVHFPRSRLAKLKPAGEKLISDVEKEKGKISLQKRKAGEKRRPFHIGIKARLLAEAGFSTREIEIEIELHTFRRLASKLARWKVDQEFGGLADRQSEYLSRFLAAGERVPNDPMPLRCLCRPRLRVSRALSLWEIAGENRLSLAHQIFEEELSAEKPLLPLESADGIREGLKGALGRTAASIREWELKAARKEAGKIADPRVKKYFYRLIQACEAAAKEKFEDAQIIFPGELDQMCLGEIGAENAQKLRSLHFVYGMFIQTACILRARFQSEESRKDLFALAYKALDALVDLVYPNTEMRSHLKRWLGDIDIAQPSGAVPAWEKVEGIIKQSLFGC